MKGEALVRLRCFHNIRPFRNHRDGSRVCRALSVPVRQAARPAVVADDWLTFDATARLKGPVAYDY